MFTLGKNEERVRKRGNLHSLKVWHQVSLSMVVVQCQPYLYVGMERECQPCQTVLPLWSPSICFFFFQKNLKK